MAKAIRAAVYLRVSTGDQTVENQRRELVEAAATRGWAVTAEYADEGVSGAKGRDQRPQLDTMLKHAVRRRFDVVMVWAVDRLGRSLPDLVSSMQELHGAKVDLFVLQQGLDTTTPSGRAMFGMLGVFAEFERSMISSRINAGLARRRDANAEAVAVGRPEDVRQPGRPKVKPSVEAAIRARLAAGEGMVRIAKAEGCGVSAVQRIKAEMAVTA